MFTIHLKNLKFFCFHGLYEEERILGNEYEVNVQVSFTDIEQVTQINQTINYVKIFEKIKQRMENPAALLETLAQDLAKNIYSLDNRIKSISINIKKVNPPIAGFEGTVEVSLKKEY